MYVQGGDDYKKHAGLDFRSFSVKHYASVINGYSKYVWSCHVTNKALQAGQDPTAFSSNSHKGNASTTGEPAAAPSGNNAGITNDERVPAPSPDNAGITNDQRVPSPNNAAVTNDQRVPTASPNNAGILNEGIPTLSGNNAPPLPVVASTVVPTFGEHLTRELSEMASEQREARLVELSKMAPTELGFAEQSAHARRLMRGLGFSATPSSTALGWGPNSQLLGKRKPAVRKGGRKGKKSRRDDDAEEGEPEGEEESEGEEGSKGEGEDEANEKEKENREEAGVDVEMLDVGTKPVKPKPRFAGGKKNQDPRQAAENAKDQLLLVDLKLGPALGPKFDYAVDLWMKSEVDARFAIDKTTGKPSTKSHKPQMRPCELTEWVKNARKAGWRPSKVVGAIDRRMVKWWVESNPEWRQMTREDGTPWLRQGDASLADVDLRGPNGFLNVMMGLKMWSERWGEGVTEPPAIWSEMLADVSWVLERVTSGHGAHAVPAINAQTPAPAAINGADEPAANAAEQSAAPVANAAAEPVANAADKPAADKTAAKAAEQSAAPAPDAADKPAADEAMDLDLGSIDLDLLLGLTPEEQDDLLKELELDNEVS
ncbi:hypothetical protein FB45DRAFT_1043199 [Roridomyces roridus]|uniref:Uncharacterized protein n=1 Tax=Roridomyces roridus TaxID=1738132 RepID=A0AAD7F6F7_9AGAR|nr:hypothetical protein FB45DRAFT_1043199 [Roridomyces roridus]